MGLLSGKKQSREDVKNKTLDALRKRNFKKATGLVAAFEAKQGHPRGLVTDWKRYDPTNDLAILRSIFGGTPSTLARLDKGKLAPLRVAVAMGHLWGEGGVTWLPEGFDTEIGIDNDIAVAQFGIYAYNKHTLRSYRASGIKKVRILGGKDTRSCDACRSIKGKVYKIGKAPELPLKGCTSSMGCRCTYLAEME